MKLTNNSKRRVKLTTGQSGSKKEREMIVVKSIGRHANRAPRDCSALTDLQKRVLGVLDRDGRTCNDIAAELGMPAQSTRSILLALSKKDRAARNPNTSLWRKT